MGTLFSTQSWRSKDAPAFIFQSGAVLDYDRLAQQVELQVEAFGPGRKLIAIEARATEAALAAYLAALEGGHAVALLAPDEPVALARFETDFAPDVTLRQIDGAWRQSAATAPRPRPLHPDLALLLSTSGSTGAGKYVRLSRENLRANAAAIARYLELDAADRSALILPLHYCYGLSVLHAHLSVGASLWLPEGGILAPGFLERLRQNRCTNLSGVPHSYRLLEEIGFRNERLPDLRFMTAAGGRLEPAIAERYHAHLASQGARLFVMYGQTEATSRIAYLPPERLPEKSDRIGVAIPGGALSLVDEAGREIQGAERPGELIYRGPNVMMGYAETRADLTRGREIDALRTGDLAIRDDEGLYRIVGRLKRMSKISGLRISHDALEQALAARGVETAVAGDDATILALHASATPDQNVRALLAEASGLPQSALRVERIEALPRLSSGKIDHQAVRERLRDAAPTPRHTVRALFADAFAPQPVREQESFVDLGGDSLRYLQVSLGLERLLGRIPQGWERLSIAELQRLTRPHEAAPARPALPRIDVDLPIRALAVLMVVVHHATHWPIPGGAAAMMLLVGLGLARFQGDALARGDLGRPLRSLALVLAPYYLVVAGYALAWGELPWASVLLIGNMGFAAPERHDMLPYLYWFVEAYAQTVLLVVGLFLIPAVRRAAARDPFAAGLAFLGGALALRFAVPDLWGLGGRRIFALPWNLYLAGFGWCAAFAVAARQKAALLAVGLVVFPLVAWLGGNWTGSWVKYLTQLGVLAALLYLPRVALPKPALDALLPVAAAGYHIYLLHRIAAERMIEPWTGALAPWAQTGLAIAGGVAVGLTAYAAQRAVQRRIRLWREAPAALRPSRQTG